MMKILQVHNKYLLSGGEDVVVDAERRLLIENGQEVELYTQNNNSIEGFCGKAKIAWNATYSVTSRKRIAQALEQFLPDIVHVHNLFPLLTPSIYDSCHEMGIPVVQTLHNFRFICSSALFMRNGKVCETCVTGTPYQALVYRCYRNSYLGSLAVARMINFHRKKGTWKNKVECFIALTEFAKNKFIQAGFPADKIVTKPNFTSFKPVTSDGSSGYALFVGRISQEKGIKVLLDAWKLFASGVPLKIVGDGPLASLVAEEVDKLPAVEWLGLKSISDVRALMEKAFVLVLPSICYEGFPMTIVEAYSAGLPVIASDLGSMASIVENGKTGLHFRAGDSLDLVNKVRWAFDHPIEMRHMGEYACKSCKEKYSSEQNYQQLISIYDSVIANYRDKSQKTPIIIPDSRSII